MQKKVGEQMIKFAIRDDEPIIMQEISNQLSQYMNGRKMASYSVISFSKGCEIVAEHFNTKALRSFLRGKPMIGISAAC